MKFIWSDQVKKTKIILWLLGISTSCCALNPIHNASYDNSHFTEGPEGNYVQGSAFFSPYANQKIRFPFSLGLKLVDDWEVGFGFKSRWHREVNNVQHLVMGSKLSTFENMTLGLDYLWGTAAAAGDGITTTVLYKQVFTPVFYGNAQVRLGFLDALVWADEGWLAGEAGFYGGARVHESFAFEFGIFTFSQVGDFKEYFGLDIEPLLVVDPGDGFKLTIGAIFGAAGNRKSRLRVETIIWYDI